MCFPFCVMALQIISSDLSLQRIISGCFLVQYDIDHGPFNIIFGRSIIHNLDIIDTGSRNGFQQPHQLVDRHRRQLPIDHNTRAACSQQLDGIVISDHAGYLLHHFECITDRFVLHQLGHIVFQSAVFHFDLRAFGFYDNAFQFIIFFSQSYRTGISSRDFFTNRLVQQMLEQQTIVPAGFLVQHKCPETIRNDRIYISRIQCLQHDSHSIYRLFSFINHFSMNPILRL